MKRRKDPVNIVSGLISPYITEWHGPSADDVVDALNDAGYVIVHLDDVPTSEPMTPGVVRDGLEDKGWRHCYDFIFGVNHE